MVRLTVWHCFWDSGCGSAVRTCDGWTNLVEHHTTRWLRRYSSAQAMCAGSCNVCIATNQCPVDASALCTAVANPTGAPEGHHTLEGKTRVLMTRIQDLLRWKGPHARFNMLCSPWTGTTRPTEQPHMHSFQFLLVHTCQRILGGEWHNSRPRAAPIAVPSTTSMTTKPSSEAKGKSFAVHTAMAPPKLWPSRTVGGFSSPNISSHSAAASALKVSFEKSGLSPGSTSGVVSP